MRFSKPLPVAVAVRAMPRFAQRSGYSRYDYPGRTRIRFSDHHRHLQRDCADAHGDGRARADYGRGAFAMVPRTLTGSTSSLSGGRCASVPPSLQVALRFFVTDDEMNHAVRRGHEEPIEIFPQLFDLIPLRNAVYL